MNGIQPAVVSMSLGGSYSKIMNAMLKYLIDSGFIISNSAGNDNKDACRYSPASVPEVTLSSSYSFLFLKKIQGVFSDSNNSFF